jgi:diguanylate cyclase (GGDEF)-like protein
MRSSRHPVLCATALLLLAFPAIGADAPVSSQVLLDDMERYQHAALHRVDVDSIENIANLDTARRALEHSTTAYLARTDAGVRTARIPALKSALDAWRAHAYAAIRSSDNRRDALRQFHSHFDAVVTELRSAIRLPDTPMRELVPPLDILRRGFVELPEADSFSEAALTDMAAAETALISILSAHAEGLGMALGEAWLTKASTDVASLPTLHAALLGTDHERRTRIDALTRDGPALRADVEATVPASDSDSPEAGAASTPGMTTSTADAPTGNTANAANTANASNPAASAAARHSAPLDWLMGGLGIGLVVVLLALIRVLLPLRRMMRAMRRPGEPSPGLRQLDEVARSVEDMTQRLSAAQALAEHDPLTQLPNRRQLFAGLTAAIERAAATNGGVGVFFLDLDNFKNINDSLGHAFGDRVLRAIAERLRECVGEQQGFAARLGGDEFTVVHSGATDLDSIHELGWELVRSLQKPLSVDGRELVVSASVGASLYPAHAGDAEALLRAADAALFRAKALGRNQLTLFSPELLAAAASRFSIEQGLRRALERGEFELVFQPELNFETRQAGLVEALLRWRTPEDGYVTPDEFLEVAEQSGLIMEISDWVLRNAIESAARWHHGAWPDARIAINVSSRQIIDGRFVERVQELLHEFRLPARCIEIELTENVLQTGPATIEALRRLRAHGVAIALDDFGTGYSSLTSLERLPLTRVKLDRTLIASIDTSARSAAIARSIVGLCHSLGLEVTAEGLERPEQLAQLPRSRAMYLQGYLISRPVSAHELLPVLAALSNHRGLFLDDDDKNDPEVNVIRHLWPA